MLLEPVEGGVKGTKGVAEETMAVFSRRRRGIRCNRVRALVVGDRNSIAREIISAVGMRRGSQSDAKAGDQQQRDPGTADPRRTQEHRIQLSDRVVLRQALAGDAPTPVAATPPDARAR
jgi:hypothetical protein